jgi:hypothetical protein
MEPYASDLEFALFCGAAALGAVGALCGDLLLRAGDGLVRAAGDDRFGDGTGAVSSGVVREGRVHRRSARAASHRRSRTPWRSRRSWACGCSTVTINGAECLAQRCTHRRRARCDGGASVVDSIRRLNVSRAFGVQRDAALALQPRMGFFATQRGVLSPHAPRRLYPPEDLAPDATRSLCASFEIRCPDDHLRGARVRRAPRRVCAERSRWWRSRRWRWCSSR